ncbi:glutamate synthase subunit beta [Corynebacterium sp. 320]|uniref:glutamate synthase subunit beta n=1 Tax=Corynebacterium TaxID=1716 RepID=UPI00125CA99E|nr:MULTISPECIES: glutamate synthase subunit beta [Corynebacterium]KAB1502710.1 glutamate synthase subunit beta [Corynebacterium sp. 320]KAB1550552.1 glutamate synthase subunit beta [Corynebacterium sp. 319]KAB1554721.1 glutamate synthase subunit beta [Corynebacterium sp. 321]KAB3526373.1 glutamate synthase subunit beta [Corynebacterium sp. 250]KAB3537782.1 glutamate synthase subunit beta [Corynebacterium sp. 366]
MADPKGFLKHTREEAEHRPVPLRLLDWNEIYEDFSDSKVQTQATRCMDCGIPFCHDGCPLGNIIPEWNDLVRKGEWKQAYDRLHATNNFPEFTGRLCPAPCEGACVLGIADDPVSIKSVELTIVEHAYANGWVQPVKPTFKTGQSVAVVGSGPAGMAAAQQLTRAGHDVTVFERADRIGGLMRYGVPEFKMEKKWIDRRIEQMEAEGTKFVVNTSPTGEDLKDFDAIVMAIGSTVGRDLPVPGRDLEGVYQAMEYLPPANRVGYGDMETSTIDAKGKHVVIIGGGDTGTDCFGTALRQGAKSVHQFDIMPKPPKSRAASTPWPTYPLKMRLASAHEEGEYTVTGDESADLAEKLALAERKPGEALGERRWQMNTVELIGEDGKVTGLKGAQCQFGPNGLENVEGTDFEMDADLVLLAMGFVSVERSAAVADLDLEVDQRGRLVRDENFRATPQAPEFAKKKVFVAGDAGRGQSLIVWGISEGRATAAAVDRALMGETALPRPIKPTDVAMRA